MDELITAVVIPFEPMIGNVLFWLVIIKVPDCVLTENKILAASAKGWWNRAMKLMIVKVQTIKTAFLCLIN